MILPAFSALPSTFSVTSNSFSERLLACTLIWMLIAGCCCWGCSEEGAFGFSKDRSFVYCASTFNWGGGAASPVERAGAVHKRPVVREPERTLLAAAPTAATGDQHPDQCARQQPLRKRVRGDAEGRGQG